MFLNEDYFDNIDITDDDLNTDSEQELYNSKDANKLIKDMFSSYRQCLRFDFSTPFDENRHTSVWNLFDKTNKWDLFRNTIRRVCNVFDAYCIKYSEPLFCTMYDWYDIKYKYKENEINWDIINIENNKVIVHANNIDLYKNLNLFLTNGLNVIMFIDLPVFNSVKNAYRFLYRMANSLQNMMIYNDDAAVVFEISKDSQNWYVKDDDMEIYLNDTRIKAIMKSTIWWLKNDILYLLSPQYKYRQEFEKAKTDRELLDFIKNH